jgi:hypothetical protein
VGVQAVLNLCENRFFVKAAKIRTWKRRQKQTSGASARDPHSATGDIGNTFIRQDGRQYLGLRWGGGQRQSTKALSPLPSEVPALDNSRRGTMYAEDTIVALAAPPGKGEQVP